MIRKLLDLSTAHVTLETSKWLERKAKSGGGDLNVSTTPYGWFFWTLCSGDLIASGLPKDLKALLTFASKNGCEYIMLDHESDEVDGLPVYSWEAVT